MTTTVHKSRKLNTIQYNSVHARLFVQRIIQKVTNLKGRMSTTRSGHTSNHSNFFIKVKRRQNANLNRLFIGHVVLTKRRTHPLSQETISRVTTQNTRRHVISSITNLHTRNGRAVVNANLRVVNNSRKRTIFKRTRSHVLVAFSTVRTLSTGTTRRCRDGRRATERSRRVRAIPFQYKVATEHVRQLRSLRHPADSRACTNGRTRCRRHSTQLHKANRSAVNVRNCNRATKSRNRHTSTSSCRPRRSQDPRHRQRRRQDGDGRHSSTGRRDSHRVNVVNQPRSPSRHALCNLGRARQHQQPINK